ncbi:MAG: tail fiber domain-containing protein [Hyphomicrobiaceae bacterium]
MQNWRTRLLAGVAAGLSIWAIPPASAGEAEATEPVTASDTYSRPGIEIGGFVSEDGGAGEVSTIVPLALRGSSALLYLGADGTLFSGGFHDLGDSVYNVGAYFGYRQRLSESGAVVGGWLGADTLETEYGQAYQRFIAGAEYFGERVIARANVFAPFDDTSTWDETLPSTTTTATYDVTTPTEVVSHRRTTTRTVTNTYEEQIPSGFDAEIGLRFALPAFDAGRRPGELRAFAGLYDYMNLKQDGGDVIGGRGRLELDLYPIATAPDVRLSLSASYSDDAHSGGQLDGGVRLAIPLGGPVAHSADTGYSGGSLKDSDPAPQQVSSGGKDLFQPVRRNNLPVSVRRLKTQTTKTAVVDKVTGRTATQTGFTLATICGGPSNPIPLIWPDFGDPAMPAFNQTILQGAIFGTPTDFSTPGAPVSVNLASLVNASGQTLAQLLANSPETFSGTFTLPALQAPYITFEMAEAFVGAATFAYLGGLYADGFTLAVNGNSCTITPLASAAAAASDRRLKRDIELLATLDDGTKLYSFRYIDSFDPSGRTFVGVMAQDVLTAHPDAVVTMSSGYYAVRYGRLGLRMASIEDWNARGLAAVRSPFVRATRRLIAH